MRMDAHACKHIACDLMVELAVCACERDSMFRRAWRVRWLAPALVIVARLYVLPLFPPVSAHVIFVFLDPFVAPLRAAHGMCLSSGADRQALGQEL